MGLEDSCEHVQDISKWSVEKTAKWLRENGFPDYEKIITSQTVINGARLLTLNENDLRGSPFCISDDNEIDHFMSCVETLRKEQLHQCMMKLDQKGTCDDMNSCDSSCKGEKKFINANAPLLSGENSSSSYNLCTTLLSEVHQNYPVEKLKTLLSLLYLLCGFVLSVTMLQLVHERVPSMEEDHPLPDIAFDLVPIRIEWAFDVCEVNGMVLVGIISLVLIFHKHRYIVARRIFFILGTLYIYRSITMWVTTLPVPGIHFRCAPKVHGKIGTMAYRAFTLLAGGGLSVTGSHHLCGDYLFSGHTVILVMSYMVIKEYTPRRFWALHWMCWVLAAVGIVCILLAHDHYTIDVVVAYLLTTRLFWTYHTMASTLSLKTTMKSNFWSKVWWFSIFKYFEGNVWGGGKLPRRYEWPLPVPAKLKHVVIKRSPIKGV